MGVLFWCTWKMESLRAITLLAKSNPSAFDRNMISHEGHTSAPHELLVKRSKSTSCVYTMQQVRNGTGKTYRVFEF